LDLDPEASVDLVPVARERDVVVEPFAGASLDPVSVGLEVEAGVEDGAR
jgi:hypothetical protein